MHTQALGLADITDARRVQRWGRLCLTAGQGQRLKLAAACLGQRFRLGRDEHR
jgi:hypothetical protein